MAWTPAPHMCPCASMNPGIIVLPPRSTSTVLRPFWAFSTALRDPTATIFPPLTATASAVGCLSFTVTIGPPK